MDPAATASSLLPEKSAASSTLSQNGVLEANAAPLTPSAAAPPIAASVLGGGEGLPSLNSTASQPGATATSSLGAGQPPAVQNAEGERIQLIDDDQHFNEHLGDYLVKWDFQDKGFDYDLCAVVGSQSTGKSTLLNKLFGTTFDVMKENERRQTTKGIWMSHASDHRPILILDVEGSDGRERGEDQDFERKSALFSMASAEVLMVNMWEHQVGLYQGANMGMLKTVFEVNLGLFQAAKSKSHIGRDKTLIFFVIRDHIAVTPMENLSNTLLADIHRIWDTLSKPEGLESASVDDFFDFDFTSLPHKLLQPKEFDQQVSQLRARFVNRDDPRFLFKPQYHKRIPADGLPRYLDSVWEQVVTNKDLDLPTQQEMLAQFRCDEIASVAFQAFISLIKPLRKPVESGSVLDALGADMGKHRSLALDKFDKEASRYHAEVYRRKRAELRDKLNTTLEPLFLGHLANLHKTLLAAFKTSIVERLRGDAYDFGQVAQEERSKVATAFKAAAALVLLQDTDWSIDEQLLQFQADIDKVADQCRAEETVKMVAQIERTLKKSIAEPVELALSKPGPEMWDRTLDAFRTALEKAETSYMQKAKTFNCTEEENTLALSALRRKSWLALRAKIDEQTADPLLMSRLRNVFEESFRYDQDGIPRIWKPEDDIDSFFSKARSETLALIPMYSKIEPLDESKAVRIPSTADDPAHKALVDRGDEDEFVFDDSLTVFNESRRADVEARFRKEADAFYVEAKRSMVSSIAQVPIWIYAVMAALGWNELVAVLRSPIYFTLLVMSMAGAYIVWRLNLGGPLISVGKAVGREVHKLADEQLRAHFSQPLPQPAILAESRSAAGGPQRVTEAKEQSGLSSAALLPADEIELKERRKKEE